MIYIYKKKIALVHNNQSKKEYSVFVATEYKCVKKKTGKKKRIIIYLYIYSKIKHIEIYLNIIFAPNLLKISVLSFN